MTVLFTLRIKLIFACLLGLMQIGMSQSLEYGNRTIGINYGFGQQNASNNRINYQYDVSLFSFEYYKNIFVTESVCVDVFAFPQFNLSKYSPMSEQASTQRGIEFGINGGFKIFGYLFKGQLKPYVIAGIGPHYVSDTPSRQSAGFIFSDNFAYGVVIGIYEDYHLDLRFGYRHISNGGLKKPNGGIDNRVVSIGIVHPLN